MNPVTTQIELRDLAGRIAEVVALAHAGNEIILMENDIPCAKLVPVSVGSSRTPDLHPGSITTTNDFDDPLPDEFWLGTP